MVQKLLDARPDLIPCNEDIFSSKHRDDPGQMDINDMMQYGYVELRYIIEWARKVPGFADLCLEDQMALLKSSFMELNVLRLAYRSIGWDGRIHFSKEITLTPTETSGLGWAKDLIGCTLEYVSRIKEIAIDESEFAIINGLVLLYPDATGIQDKAGVTSLQSHILDCLRKYTTHTYPHDPRRYGKILLRLPALRTISAKAAEQFLSMSLDGSIKMNALVLEMMS